MHPVQHPTPKTTSHSTLLGILGLLCVSCCLFCLPSSVAAKGLGNYRPHNMGMEESGFGQPDFSGSNALTPQSRPLSSSVEQALRTSANESLSPQRKKKKKPLPVNMHKLTFMAWLSAFCLPPSAAPFENTAFRAHQREAQPRLPSWRGFVFFAMPPPLA